MMSYRIDEADLEINPDWHDQSLNIFKLPSAPNGKEASFVVSRDVQRKSFRTFEEYATKQREQLKEKLPGFKLLKDENIEYQDHVGLWLEFIWRNGDSDMQIRQVFYDRKQTALICTLTYSPADDAHFNGVWRRMMGAMKLRALPADEAVPVFPPPEAIRDKKN